VEDGRNVNLEGAVPGALFSGVPVLLKDNTRGIKGVRLTLGSKLFQVYRAKEDEEYVRRLWKTGFLFLGYTNVPEFCLMGIT